jgi:hypothetical protein
MFPWEHLANPSSRAFLAITMSLPGAVESATPSVLGFDTDSIVSATLAAQFYALGYKFCIRYLSLREQSSQDLTTDEATNILNSGLALMPVQHVRNPGWSPMAEIGQQDGQNAASNAQQIGFPSGVSVWCDLEGIVKTAAPQDVVGYCESWYNAVNSAGYVPGLYVGYQAILNGDQLHSLSFQHYWRSQSSVPPIPNRGYQLVQFLPSVTANGIAIDVDFTQTDNLGGQAPWLHLA